MARDIKYNDSLSSSTNATVTFQTKTSLTFTPQANTDYFILASALFSGSSATVDFKSRLNDGTVDYFAHDVESGSTTDVLPDFAVVRIPGSASPTQKTYNYQFAAEATTLTATMSDAAMLAFSRDAADGYAEQIASVSVSSTTYVNLLSVPLSVASTGDYLIVFSGEADTATAPNDVGFRITVDGVEQVSALQVSKESVNWNPVGAVLTVNLTAGTRTINVDHNTNATVVSNLRNACLAIIRLDTFENNWSNSNRTLAQVNSVTPTDFVSLTATGSAPGDNIVFASFFAGVNATANAHRWQLVDDTSTSITSRTGYALVRPSTASTTRGYPAGWLFVRQTYSDTSGGANRGWKLQQYTSSAGVSVWTDEGFLSAIDLTTTPATSTSAPALDRIERGLVTLANGSSSVTVTVPAVTMDKSLLLFSFRGVGNATGTDDSIGGNITNSTTLTFARSGTVGDVIIEWQVICWSSDVLVQRGSLFPTLATNTINLPQSAPRDKSLVVITNWQPSASWNGDDWQRGNIPSDSVLKISSPADANVTVEWQVVTFTNVIVQAAESSNTTTSATVALFPAINPAKSILIYSYELAATGTCVPSTHALMATLGNNAVSFSRNAAGSTAALTLLCAQQVATFDAGWAVYHLTASFGTTGTSVDIPIGGTVDPAKTFVIVGGMRNFGRSTYTTTDNFMYACATAKILDSTTVRVERSLTGNTLTIPVQVVYSNAAPGQTASGSASISHSCSVSAQITSEARIAVTLATLTSSVASVVSPEARVTASVPHTSTLTAVVKSEVQSAASTLSLTQTVAATVRSEVLIGADPISYSHTVSAEISPEFRTTVSVPYAHTVAVEVNPEARIAASLSLTHTVAATILCDVLSIAPITAYNVTTDAVVSRTALAETSLLYDTAVLATASPEESHSGSALIGHSVTVSSIVQSEAQSAADALSLTSTVSAQIRPEASVQPVIQAEVVAQAIVNPETRVGLPVFGYTAAITVLPEKGVSNLVAIPYVSATIANVIKDSRLSSLISDNVAISAEVLSDRHAEAFSVPLNYTINTFGISEGEAARAAIIPVGSVNLYANEDPPAPLGAFSSGFSSGFSISPANTGLGSFSSGFSSGFAISQPADTQQGFSSGFSSGFASPQAGQTPSVKEVFVAPILSVGTVLATAEPQSDIIVSATISCLGSVLALPHVGKSDAVVVTKSHNILASATASEAAEAQASINVGAIAVLAGVRVETYADLTLSSSVEIIAAVACEVKTTPFVSLLESSSAEVDVGKSVDAIITSTQSVSAAYVLAESAVVQVELNHDHEVAVDSEKFSDVQADVFSLGSVDAEIYVGKGNAAVIASTQTLLASYVLGETSTAQAQVSHIHGITASSEKASTVQAQTGLSSSLTSLVETEHFSVANPVVYVQSVGASSNAEDLISASALVEHDIEADATVEIDVRVTPAVIAYTHSITSSAPSAKTADVLVGHTSSVNASAQAEALAAAIIAASYEISAQAQSTSLGSVINSTTVSTEASVTKTVDAALNLSFEQTVQGSGRKEAQTAISIPLTILDWDSDTEVYKTGTVALSAEVETAAIGVAADVGSAVFAIALNQQVQADVAKASESAASLSHVSNVDAAIRTTSEATASVSLSVGALASGQRGFLATTSTSVQVDVGALVAKGAKADISEAYTTSSVSAGVKTSLSLASVSALTAVSGTVATERHVVALGLASSHVQGVSYSERFGVAEVAYTLSGVAQGLTVPPDLMLGKIPLLASFDLIVGVSGQIESTVALSGIANQAS